jgi:hypothetical protein
VDYDLTVRTFLSLLLLLCATPAWADGEIDLDLDGDSYSLADGDCDDTRAWVYPGAPEACDGLDSDCDGVIPSSADAGEQDSDGDGWRACGGDCNDTVTAINPAAVELCDDIDNDCDGVRPLGEQDNDLDGVAPCEGDCNDDDAGVRPGRTDAPGDVGVDNNCDGVIDEGGGIEDDEPTPDLPPGCAARGCGWSLRSSAPQGDRRSPLLAFGALTLLIGRRRRDL